MDITQGKDINTIFGISRSIIKKHRKELLLIGLFGWVVSQGIQWYVDQKVNLEGLMSSIETSMENKVPEYMQLFMSGEPVTLEAIGGMYGETWSMIQPHIPTFLMTWILGAIVSMLIYMIIAHLTFNEVEGKQQSRASLATTIRKKIIPYTITVLIQGVSILFLLGLFIIPGIIAGGYWLFTNAVALHKDIYYFSAMKESRRIVKGRRRDTAGTAFILGIIASTALVIITTVLASTSSIASYSTQIGITSMVTTVLSVAIQIMMIVFYLRWEKTTIDPTNTSTS